jgi:uncharacterized protein (DUF58 family)
VKTIDLLKKIKRLEIKTKGLTKQIFSGEYHSAFKGKGMAFSEVRNYHYGDEVRTIDWNVTARFNEPFVKVFEEERELTVMLVIDLSGSDTFGTKGKTKKELALEIAAVLSFSAINNNDKIGAIFISDRVEKYIPANKGRKHALLILRELIEFEPESLKTDLGEGLKFFRNTQKKRTICFVISDFIDENDFLNPIQLNNKMHDMVAIVLKDKGEAVIPKMGIVQVKNLESGKLSWVNTNNEDVREAYANNFNKHQELIMNSFRKSGIDHALIATDEDLVLPLVSLFKHRKK